MILHEDICRFLKGNGLECSTEEIEGYQVIRSGNNPAILPVSISETDPDQARTKAEATMRLVRILSKQTGSYPLIITEDRWRSQTDMMQRRLLAHLHIYVQIYARNCEVRKIDKKTAAEFLQANHSYGDAACRHRYGLYLKRYTGHTVLHDKADDGPTEQPISGDSVSRYPGTERPGVGDLVAVATFSNGRKWIKGEKTIRSFEWTRYASLPGVRLSGGMGRLLKAFIEDVKPDDIMTYADLEWSEGGIYEALGFELEGVKSPVLFEVDGIGWQRSARIGLGVAYGDPRLRCAQTPPSRGWHVTSGHHPALDASTVLDTLTSEISSDNSHQEMSEYAIKYFQNLGSNKYRLKLTDYQ